MKDIEAVDFLKKARLYWNVPRKNGKQVTMELYIEAMTKAINALEEKTKALPLPDRPHGEWKHAIVDCYKSGYICPHCNGFAVIDGKSDGYSVTFCPNCGSNNRPKEGDENE